MSPSRNQLGSPTFSYARWLHSNVLIQLSTTRLHASHYQVSLILNRSFCLRRIYISTVLRPAMQASKHLFRTQTYMFQDSFRVLQTAKSTELHKITKKWILGLRMQRVHNEQWEIVRAQTSIVWDTWGSGDSRALFCGRGVRCGCVEDPVTGRQWMRRLRSEQIHYDPE
jgi:hypothetical protein